MTDEVTQEKMDKFIDNIMNLTTQLCDSFRDGRMAEAAVESALLSDLAGHLNTYTNIIATNNIKEHLFDAVEMQDVGDITSPGVYL